MSITRRAAAPAAVIFAGLALVAPAADAAKKKAPTVLNIKSGSTMLTLDPALAPVLQQQGISVAPLAPAKLQAADTISLPISSGTLNLKKGTLKLKHKGGLALSGGPLPLTIDVKNAIIDATRSGSKLSADTLLGSGTELLTISGLSVPKKVTGKSLNLVGSATFVDSIGGTLKGFVPDLPGPPITFGTLTISAKFK